MRTPMRTRSVSVVCVAGCVGPSHVGVVGRLGKTTDEVAAHFINLN